MAKHIL